MSPDSFSRLKLAVAASVAVLAFAGSSAQATNSQRHVLVTCPAEHNPVSTTHHITGIQFRNVTSLSHVMLVNSVKAYDRGGALVLSMPPTPLPSGFVADLPAYATTVFSTNEVFGADSQPALSIVFDMQVRGNPFLVFAVHLDVAPDGSVASRAIEPCVEQW